MSTVQLAVRSEDRQSRLARILEEGERVTEVRSSEEPISRANLLVVDVTTLHEHGDGLLEECQPRGTEEPVPVILIAPESWLAQPDPVLWERVDEVMGTPVREANLKGRVQVLLQSRRDIEKNRTGSRVSFTSRRQGREGIEWSREQGRIARLGRWEWDLERERLRWSEETYRIFGLSPEEDITYERFMDAVHPEDRDTVRRHQERLLKQGIPIDVEYRAFRPDGEERIVREQGELDRREDGTPVQLFGTALDVTEQRHRERKVERLRKKYEGLLRGAPDAIFVADAETGQILEANQAAASLLDTSIGELIGRHQSELHPPDEKGQYRSLFKRHKHRAKSGAETLRRLADGSQIYVVSDSGERIPVEINAAFVDLDGEELFVGVFRDVRGRREARRRRRILEQAVAQTKDAVFVTDTQGTVLYANPATEEITGYDREEFIGEDPCLLQSGETSEETYQKLWSALEEEEVFRGTLTDRRKDGGKIQLEQTITPVENESGEIAYYVSTGRDVTERVERELKLRHQKKLLEQRRNLLEQTQRLTGAWEVDLRTGQVLWSKKVYRIHKVPLGRGIGLEEVLEFYPPEAQSKLREVGRRLRAGKQFEVELPLSTAEGTRRWVCLVGAPVDEEEDPLARVAGAIQDVTTRKRREQQLERARERMELALQETGAVVWDLDVESGQIKYSPSSETLYGANVETLADFLEQVHPDDRATVMERLEEGRAAGEYAVEFRIERNGDTRWVASTGRFEFDEEGTPVRGLGVAQDITERKE